MVREDREKNHDILVPIGINITSERRRPSDHTSGSDVLVSFGQLQGSLQRFGLFKWVGVSNNVFETKPLLKLNIIWIYLTEHKDYFNWKNSLLFSYKQKHTWSPSHCMHKAPSFSSKNSTPSWLARSGIYSIIASRTRQCLSSASSTIAGRRDCESKSIPITCTCGQLQFNPQICLTAIHLLLVSGALQRICEFLCIYVNYKMKSKGNF